jgi:hypothetical protein
MNKIKIFSKTIIAALLLGSCSKNTMVSGKVTNYKNGNPVAGMEVTLNVYDGHNPRDSNNPKLAGSTTTRTDKDGFYSLEYKEKGIDNASLWLDAGRLCTNFFEEIRSDNIEVNGHSKIDIQIDSIDASLEVLLSNTTATSRTIFLSVDCDAVPPKGVYCCGSISKIDLNVQESKTIQYKISGNRPVGIYWGDTSFTNWAAPHVDSLYCPSYKKSQFNIRL